jgi:hypothetical protein
MVVVQCQNNQWEWDSKAYKKGYPLLEKPFRGTEDFCKVQSKGQKVRITLHENATINKCILMIEMHDNCFTVPWDEPGKTRKNVWVNIHSQIQGLITQSVFKSQHKKNTYKGKNSKKGQKCQDIADALMLAASKRITRMQSEHAKSPSVWGHPNDETTSRIEIQIRVTLVNSWIHWICHRRESRCAK